MKSIQQVSHEYPSISSETGTCPRVFESFFKKAASLDTNSLLKRRKITIYTKLYNDRLDIEYHLRQMVGSDVTLLKNLNDFYIICKN